MKTEKIYYKEPYKIKIEALVLKSYADGNYFCVILDKTIFFPTGGGQSNDIGTIGNAEVIDVFIKDGEIYHKISKELTVGLKYICKLDWARRFSFMQHHSIEHIVSGLVKKYYNGKNVGFHLGSKFVTMDYDIILSDEDILVLEDLCNDVIYKNLPIKITYHDEMPDFDFRSKIEIDETIRIVTVEDYDVCACCGTHVLKTGEIGIMKIVDHHKYKGGTRLYMLCGKKSLKDYQQKQEIVYSLKELLSLKTEEIYVGVKKLLDEKNSIEYKFNNLKKENLKDLFVKVKDEKTKIFFLENYNINELTFLYKESKKCTEFLAVFSKQNDRYLFLIYSCLHELNFIKEIIETQLNGKGGGKDYITGSVEASKVQIENFLENLLNFK